MFGVRLARLREAANLSQSGLARLIGVSQSAISQLESGDRNPSYGMLIQLADGVGVSLADLVAGTEAKAPPPPYVEVEYADGWAAPAAPADAPLPAAPGGGRDTWDLIEFMREAGWCLELNNNGLPGGDRYWTATFSDWARHGQPGWRVEAEHAKPQDAIANAVAEVAGGVNAR